MSAAVAVLDGLYTSYETSVALRDAGADQGNDTSTKRRQGDGALVFPWSGIGEDPRFVRAFRADEILVALSAMLGQPKRVRIEVFFDGSAIVSHFPGLPAFMRPSLVEAAAACWFATLVPAPAATPLPRGAQP